VIKVWECTECGYEQESDHPPTKCPECGADAEMFDLYEYEDDDWDNWDDEEDEEGEDEDES
jgi:rubredoxin